VTIEEVMDQGLEKIRLPIWSEGVYLHLIRLSDGGYSPWATLHDLAAEKALRIGPQRISVVGLGEDDRWEAARS